MQIKRLLIPVYRLIYSRPLWSETRRPYASPKFHCVELIYSFARDPISSN